MPKIDTVAQFRDVLEKGPYTSTGSYPIYFITGDYTPLSYQAASDNIDEIVEAIQGEGNPHWRVIGFEVNWEDPDLYCDHGGGRIESAYAEPEETLREPSLPPSELGESTIEDVIEALVKEAEGDQKEAVVEGVSEADFLLVQKWLGPCQLSVTRDPQGTLRIRMADS